MLIIAEAAPFLSTVTLTFTFTTNLPPSNQVYQNQRPSQGTSINSNNLQNFETSASDTCSEYFSYRNDHTGTIGLLMIKRPDRYRNDVKAVMTLASRLHSVSFDLFSIKILSLFKYILCRTTMDQCNFSTVTKNQFVWSTMVCHFC